jgi:hypothetical protein
VVNDETNPVPVTVQNPNGERQFVGFSDVTVNGGSGWPAVNAACTSKFGTGARICLDSEIYMNGGPSLPMALETVYGLVAPKLPYIDGGSNTCFDFKLASAISDVTHVINSDTGELKTASPGATIEDRFRLPGSCASSYPVTCCQ